MLDSLIECWKRQREALVQELDRTVAGAEFVNRTIQPTSLATFEASAARTIKKIAKLDDRISTAEVLRRRYVPARTPSPAEHALAIAILLVEGDRV